MDDNDLQPKIIINNNNNNNLKISTFQVRKIWETDVACPPFDAKMSKPLMNHQPSQSCQLFPTLRVHGIQFNVEPLQMASLLIVYDTFPAGQSPYS